MTWRDCKLITLQRMFAVSGDEIIQDDTTLPYIKSMPGAANEGLQLLATAGKFLVKSVQIQQPAADPPEGELPEFISGSLSGGMMKYHLREQAPDFYMLRDGQVFLQSNGRYGRTYDFMTEGDGILVLNAAQEGIWTVYYNAYPAPITVTTPDKQELALDPEAAVLLPLYMASQLYKDDDIGQAVQFRNEFEAGREILAASASRDYFGRESFTSSTGWW